MGWWWGRCTWWDRRGGVWTARRQGGVRLAGVDVGCGGRGMEGGGCWGPWRRRFRIRHVGGVSVRWGGLALALKRGHHQGGECSTPSVHAASGASQSWHPTRKQPTQLRSRHQSSSSSSSSCSLTITPPTIHRTSRTIAPRSHRSCRRPRNRRSTRNSWWLSQLHPTPSPTSSRDLRVDYRRAAIIRLRLLQPDPLGDVTVECTLDLSVSIVGGL